MAFQAPNTGQERANRKILEQLEEQKKKLRNSQAPITSSTPTSASVTTPAMTAVTTTTPSPATKPQKALNPESVHMTPAQRTAIQHAHANSVGYFITQDSSFGNLILPVLPRFDIPVTATDKS